MRRRAAGALLIVAFAACKPAVKGLCSKQGDCRSGAYCSSAGVCLAVPPLAISVFVPPAADSVNGWVPRTSGTLDVRATLDDGGAGATQAATLTFDTCPAAVPCTYPGTIVSQESGVTTFSFQVPRFAQSAGSEAPLPVTVTAIDVAANKAQGKGSLQIDDAPPTVGPLVLVSRGVSGEDRNTWFAGGSGAPDVEIAEPFQDSGSGPASLVLHLDKDDLFGGFSGSLDLTGVQQADGVHFHVPASAVQGREGKLRFTLTAKDALGNTATVGPDDPNTAIWVDAQPPTIVAPPQVDYANAAPASACGSGASLTCGRQGGTHLLADDSATVSFDAFDCGSGIASSASTLAAGGSHVLSANEKKPVTSGSCANGNAIHHFQVTLDLATVGAPFDSPDATGTTLMQLVAAAQDRIGSGTTAAGRALISLWRWKNQIGGSFAGAPALMPGNAGSRQVAVATTATSGANVFVLGPDGSLAWSAAAGQTLTSDVAAGARNLYVSGAAAMDIVVPPAGNGSTGSVDGCSVTGISFGTPPAVVVDGSTERAVVTSSAHSGGAVGNVFVFTENGGCAKETDTIELGDYPGGVSASWPTVFVANQGFISEARLAGGGGFDLTTEAPYRFASGSLSSPPAVVPGVSRVFFGTTDTKLLHVAMPCASPAHCWTDDPNFTAQQASNPIPATPVYDGSFIYAADSGGVLYAYPFSGTGIAWSVNFQNAMLFGSAASGATISPPIVLQNGTVLVVRSDGAVAIASSSTTYSGLVKVGAGAAQAPVLDVRGSGGVAYIADGQGTLWAVQTQLPGVPAQQGTWPRPGRDSCNSRNAVSSCQ